MFRWGLLLMFMLFGLATSATAEELTQRDWMEQLVDNLGWGYGLPDDPVTADYIALLSGQRNLHIEVEDNHRRSDRIAIKRLTNYGQFSGSGWASGRRDPAQLHLDILVPHNGRYQLSAVTRLPGVQLQFAGQEFTASAGDNLTYQELGQVDLAAGVVEIIVTLPPNAGIDYLQLRAFPLPLIAPLGGWQPDRPLEVVDLAVTTLQALELLQVLPLSGASSRFEAETAPAQEGVRLVYDRHLGVPSGNAWLRAGNLQKDWHLQFSEQQSGCYQLLLRGSSKLPVSVAVSGILEKRVLFGPVLRDSYLGSYCLPRGDFSLNLILPPWAGVDSFEMRDLDIGDDTLLRLLGFPALSSETVANRQTVNELLKVLSNLTH